MNWYAYCGNNPLNYVDPTGLGRTNDDYDYMKSQTDGKGDVGQGQTGPAEKPTPDEMYSEWAKSLWDAKNEANRREQELRRQLRDGMDKSEFGDKWDLFNCGIYDVFGPEYKEVAAELAYLRALEGTASEVKRWLEDSDSKGNYRSFDNIITFAHDAIKKIQYAKTVNALLLIGAAAIQNNGHGLIERARAGSENGSAGNVTSVGYHATTPEAAESILQNGFRLGTKPGRLGSGGVYVNNTVEGAMAEFAQRNPGISPSVLRVQYQTGVNAMATKPPANYVMQYPLNVGSISAESVRLP